MRALMTILTLVGLLATGAAHADCPGSEEVGRFVADWQARRPAKALGVANQSEAACAREKVVAALGGSLGKVVGYKAGLTSKAVQERFKADAPVRGVLLEGMILGDGAVVPASYGARAVWEADMLLVVKDRAINEARTPEEALRHISGMRPFIELPDLALAPGEILDGTQLAAINVAARLGVAGAEVPLRADADTVRLLAETSIVATDGSGAVLAQGTGAATLGNPLNAVLWLIQDLAGSGGALRPGDLISVGSFTPLTPPRPGQRITVRYEGLPGSPQVSVGFE